jgi:hypothetical protein
MAPKAKAAYPKMAPKAKAAAKTGASKKKKVLKTPEVSEDALAKARTILADEAELKRRRSSLMYQLEISGEKHAYDHMGSKDMKKQWIEAKIAEQIADGTIEVKAEKSNTVVVENSKSGEGQWYGKEALILMLGARKAQAKIDSGKLPTRPDPDTGLEGEWDIEYKFVQVKEIKSEVDRTETKISGEQELGDKDAIQAAQDELKDIKEAIAAGSTASASAGTGTVVAAQPTSASGTASVAAAGPTIKQEADKTAETHKKTLESLVKDRRKVFLSCSETLTVLKTYFKDTESGRYTVQLNEDIKKLVPKYTKLLKKLEAATISQLEDKTTLLGLAVELDGLYDEFNAVEDWYYRLIPDAVDKLGKKRKRL